jgi:hypothetical protein
MTLRVFLIATVLALFVGVVAGVTFGYRYAAGRCAAEKLEAAAEAERVVKVALETATKQQREANAAASRAAQAENALTARQSGERVRYVQVIKRVEVPADCRIPDDALGLLVNAARAANASAAATAAD